MKATKKICAALAALVLAVSACPATLYTTAAELIPAETTAVETVELPVTDTADSENVTTASGGHWYTSPAGNKFYFDANGNKATGWWKIDGKKYYFRASGVMQTMWAKIGGNKYYFGKTGVMRTMWQTIGGKKYYFGGTGVMRTMWETIGGKKYYFGKTGVMRTGWEKIGGNKYYFGLSGVMRTGFQVINGNTYYFGKSGIMRTMWETIGGYRYYFGGTGVMRTGLEKVKNQYYYFLSDGTCYWRTPIWKYLYQNKVDSIASSAGSYDGFRFQLVYVDSDDIPELVISEGDCHADGCEVYTVKNNQLYYLGGCSDNGYGTFSYVRKAGLILSGFYNMGHGSYEIYKMNSTYLSTLHTAEIDDNLNPYRKIDGSYVSDSTCNAFFASYTSRSDYYTIWHEDFKYSIYQSYIPFAKVYYQ